MCALSTVACASFVLDCRYKKKTYQKKRNERQARKKSRQILLRPAQVMFHSISAIVLFESGANFLKTPLSEKVNPRFSRLSVDWMSNDGRIYWVRQETDSRRNVPMLIERANLNKKQTKRKRPFTVDFSMHGSRCFETSTLEKPLQIYGRTRDRDRDRTDRQTARSSYRDAS